MLVEPGTLTSMINASPALNSNGVIGVDPVTFTKPDTFLTYGLNVPVVVPNVS